MVKQWYEEAVRGGITEYSPYGKEETFILYKGFKITQRGEDYNIEDIRINDFYDDVDEYSINTLKTKGFIKGADILSYKRNLRRVDYYTSILERLFENRDIYNSKLHENKTFYKKKLKNVMDGVLKYTDLLFFYKAKTLQHEQKYNLI